MYIISSTSSPARLYIFVTLIISSGDRGGNKSRSDLASRVFPLPGGPFNNRLCRPAAAIINARLACSCPMILSSGFLGIVGEYFLLRDLFCVDADINNSPFRCKNNSFRLCTGIIFIPDIRLACCRFFIGIKICLILAFLAISIIFITPRMGLIDPSKASSPAKAELQIFLLLS